MASVPCSCGQHHPISALLAFTIEAFGRNIRVTGPAGTWWVPRVYIAAHGRISEEDLAPLALTYGWRPDHSGSRQVL